MSLSSISGSSKIEGSSILEFLINIFIGYSEVYSNESKKSSVSMVRGTQNSVLVGREVAEKVRLPSLLWVHWS